MKKEAGPSVDLWGIFLQTYLLTFLQKQRVRTKTLYSDHYTIEWSLYYHYTTLVTLNLNGISKITWN